MSNVIAFFKFATEFCLNIEPDFAENLEMIESSPDNDKLKSLLQTSY